ncbi:uncharacterized protein LOC113237282 [Hyposmocoma kahamanoa]|uniref:uncharacterized protein LOC113237282 n=1 Tax=Hyposmocoma kahamanoa TaxID=1477025 RepID=UPI000E6D744F|nr:uncharacterized protein LOC113237282 [Hyposmocoma kahamanoa]
MLPYWSIVPALLLLLCKEISPYYDDKATKTICPSGFDNARIALNPVELLHICYKLKGPELFEDKFTDCAGNLMTSRVYHSVDFPIQSGKLFWTDYKSLYPGGPFIDWSYTNSMGVMLPPHYNVSYEPGLASVEEELCIVVDSDSNFEAVKCNQKHYRYCVVLPLENKEKDMDRDGCEDNYWRFWGPRPTCLTSVTLHESKTVTWEQAEKLCVKRKGSLLSTGWIYASSSLFPPAILPLGVTLSADNTTLEIVNDNIKILPSEFGIKNNKISNARLGAMVHNFCFMVNSSQKFSNIICERPINLRPISMNVSINSLKQLILITNETVKENKIRCFTDSVGYYPHTVKVRYAGHYYSYNLQPLNDGYYWCVHIDSRNHTVSESNKALFIQREDFLINSFAVKLRFSKCYFDIVNFYNELKQYIYYWNKYVENNFDDVNNQNTTEDVLKLFKEKHTALHSYYADVISKHTIKKLSVDKKNMLVHVRLRRDMKPVLPGTWANLTVEFMKPVYYCPAFGMVDSAPIGTSITVNGETHTCTGDFNEGVQWVTKNSASCITTPKKQLQHVIKNLSELVNNTAPVVISDLNPAFDKVDSLLNTKESLENAGRLLILLDQVGGKVDLNGSRQVSIVRKNVAILLADSSAEQPVRGLKIAAMAGDGVLNDGRFEIISDQINSTHLMSNKSEAVINLPESIAKGQHRISFVVFKNDRVFPSTRLITVNSQILSIKVGNVTKFHHGEVIDIHFSPLQENLKHNQRRACAYWQFFENGTGVWSREGCIFIKSGEEGVLDTCRCVHLTHFAQILISKDLFSQKHEYLLEILSIVGCCLSIFGILMIGTTAALFKSWRQDYNNKIWLHLCFAILLLVICFLVIVFAKFDHYNIPCMLVGVLLHYSVLASFCWMLVAAVLSYLRLVIVFRRGASHRLLKSAAFAWGVPCIIVGILLSAAPHSYAGPLEEKHPSGAFCYPSGLGLWLAVYAPAVLILLANLTLYGVIVRSVNSSKKIQRHCNSKETLKCVSVSCLLIFLFGLPWIFGLFAHNIVLAYIFTLTATFQGFILFLFFIVGNRKTRELWLKKLKTKQTPKLSAATSTFGL